MSETELVLFKLVRHEDESGVSGTGVVAYGVKFPEPNARVILGWVPAEDRTSVAVYDSLEQLEAIHGHGGRTEVVPMQKIDCYSDLE